MAEYRKNISNESMINALIQFGTVREAAENLGCKARTIYHRMNNDLEFIEDFNAAKKDITRKAVASFNNKLSLAIDEIFNIMTDKSVNAAIRLQAAQTILNNAGKFADRLEKADTSMQKDDETPVVLQKPANTWEEYSPFVEVDENEIDFSL